MGRILFGLLAAYAAVPLVFVALYALSSTDATVRAIILMGLGLVFVWVVLCGSLMFFFRSQIKNFAASIRLGWKAKFVLFATILALIEEAVAVFMTNLAPVLGATTQEAFITASPNFFETVLFHSVIIFIPMFLAWAWLLSKYDFSPNKVFFLFGLLGNIIELGYGLQNIFAGFWIFVYGLMVYLPAYSLPERSNLKKPSALHYLLALALPFICGLLMAAILSAVRGVPTSGLE